MDNYIISCCSTADLSAEHFQEKDLHYICFHFSLNGKTYDDDLGRSISFEDFYQAMVSGADTKTSQVNADEFIQYFTPWLEQGKDIIHVCLSSGISGVWNSAMIAQRELQARFPERKLYIVDSLGASSGYGLLMDQLAELRAAGMDIDELYTWAEAHKLEVHHWFFSTDLAFYIKGGRISKASGIVGTLLGICPLLNMDMEGHLVPQEKIRTKKKMIQRIVDKMESCVQNGLDYAGKCYISHSACLSDAQAVAALIEARFKRLNGPVEINNIGTTIGSHTGPGTVALFFWGAPRLA